MSEIFASPQIPAIKNSGLVLAMVLCASLLSACDCDGDCNVGSATSAVATTPAVADPAVPPATTPPPATTSPAACIGRFCKVGSTGARLDPAATSWSCVEDTATGSFWEVKTDDSALRDKDWTYAAAGAAGACGGTLAACTPTAYAAAVNAAATRPCGTTRTCRLPTHAELMYLAFPAAFLPTASPRVTSTPTATAYIPDAAFFPETVMDGFYFNATDGRQVNYGYVVPADTSVDAISLTPMAPAAGPELAGHIRLICE